MYALDLYASLLDELAGLASRQEITTVRTVHGDARSLTDHLPGAVDVVLVANTFHGVDNPLAFLEEVTAALAEDGRFVVVNWRDVPRETMTVAGDPRGPPAERRRSPAANRRLV